MFNVPIILLVFLFISGQITAMESAKCTSLKTELMRYVVCDLSENETFAIPEEIVNKFQTIKNAIQDFSELLGTENNEYHLPLLTVKKNYLKLIIDCLKVIKEYELSQNKKITSKDQSINDKDDHIVETMIYELINPFLCKLSFKQFIELFNIVNYLDVTYSSGKNYLYDAVLKHLVWQFIIEKNINLLEIQSKQPFKELLLALPTDHHELVHEQIEFLRRQALYEDSFNRASREIKRIVQSINNKDELADKDKFISLAGPSYSGKTILAKAIAYEFKKEFIMLNGYELNYLDKGVEQARKKNAVLILDGLDDVITESACIKPDTDASEISNKLLQFLACDLKDDKDIPLIIHTVNNLKNLDRLLRQKLEDGHIFYMNSNFNKSESKK